MGDFYLKKTGKVSREKSTILAGRDYAYNPRGMGVAIAISVPRLGGRINVKIGIFWGQKKAILVQRKVTFISWKKLDYSSNSVSGGDYTRLSSYYGRDANNQQIGRCPVQIARLFRDLPISHNFLVNSIIGGLNTGQGYEILY